MNRRWLLGIWLIGLAYACLSDRAILREPGILVAAAPRQYHVDPAPQAFDKDGYHIQPLARFEAEGRVLGKKYYYLDAGARLAPVDLALGWGRMSDSTVLAFFEVEQCNRFYFWRTDQCPIPPREVEAHSANMHIIPANNRIAKKLKWIRPGHLVQFSGYLVEARLTNGMKWRSSLTRNDIGAGACELVWVDALEVYD